MSVNKNRVLGTRWLWRLLRPKALVQDTGFWAMVLNHEVALVRIFADSSWLTEGFCSNLWGGCLPSHWVAQSEVVGLDFADILLRVHFEPGVPNGLEFSSFRLPEDGISTSWNFVFVWIYLFLAQDLFLHELQKRVLCCLFPITRHWICKTHVNL